MFLLRRNLLADAVFLLVQNFLFGLGNVAAVLTGHVPLFLANLVVVLVQRRRLTLRQRAIFNVVMDSLVLIVEAIIYLLAPRVIFLPGGVSRSGAGNRTEHCNRDREHEKPFP